MDVEFDYDAIATITKYMKNLNSYLIFTLVHATPVTQLPMPSTATLRSPIYFIALSLNLSLDHSTSQLAAFSGMDNSYNPILLIISIIILPHRHH